MMPLVLVALALLLALIFLARGRSRDSSGTSRLERFRRGQAVPAKKERLGPLGLLSSIADWAGGMLPARLQHIVAGDLAAAGALVGLRTLWVSFLAGAAIAGALALLLLVRRERSVARLKQRLVLLHAGLLRTPPQMQRRAYDAGYDVKIPYAVPLSLGLVIVSSISWFG